MATTTLETAARNAACNAIVDLLDVGGAGSLEYKTSAGTSTKGNGAVATLGLAATAFGASGAVNPGEAVSAAISSDTNAAGGVAAKAYMYSGANAPILSGDVSTIAVGTGAFLLSNTTVTAGETVSHTLGSITVTVPA